MIATLRTTGRRSTLEHADHVKQLLEQHGPGGATMRFSLTDDVILRSSTWARWQLGIPLPVE